jgi:hypothetical protein
MNKPVFILAILMLFGATSCTKKSTTPTTTPNPNPVTFLTYQSINVVFGLLTLPTKTVTINADSGGAFYGNSGTRYVFPKSAFQTAAAGNVSGNVQITVFEVLKKGDMIFNQVLPESNGDPLYSGGEINISAAQSSKQIFLKPSTTFEADIPQTGYYDSITSFYSGRVLAGNLSNNVNWTFNNVSSPGFITNIGDTIRLFCDSLQWCNAARTLSFPNYQSFKVTVIATNNTVDATSSLLTYVMYDKHKGVYAMTGLNGNVYTETHVANIPVHFVSMALINGHFFAGVTAVTPTNNGNYTVTMTEVDPYAFKGQLNELYP